MPATLTTEELKDSIVGHFEEFNKPQTFTAFEGRVQGNVIKGVSLIQKGPALGHKYHGFDLGVDEKALIEFARIAKGMGRLKVKFNHFTGIQDTVGYAQNFRVSGDKVLADVTLLKSHPSKEMLLEMVDEMSSTFGVSLMFSNPEPEWDQQAEVFYVRPKMLLSADFVDIPAANRTGVFSAEIDKADEDMPAITVEAFDAYKAEAAKVQADAIAALQAEIAALKTALEKPAETPAPPAPEPAALEKKADDIILAAELAEVKTLLKALAAAPATNQQAAPVSQSDDENPNEKTRQQFEALSHADRNAFMAAGGKLKN